MTVILGCMEVSEEKAMLPASGRMPEFSAKCTQRLAGWSGRLDGKEFTAAADEPRSKIRGAGLAQAFDIVIDVAAAGVAAQIQDGRVDANRARVALRGALERP